LGPFEWRLAKGGRFEDGVRFVADFDLGVLKLLPPKVPRAAVTREAGSIDPERPRFFPADGVLAEAPDLVGNFDFLVEP